MQDAAKVSLEGRVKKCGNSVGVCVCAWERMRATPPTATEKQPRRRKYNAVDDPDLIAPVHLSIVGCIYREDTRTLWSIETDSARNRKSIAEAGTVCEAARGHQKRGLTTNMDHSDEKIAVGKTEGAAVAGTSVTEREINSNGSISPAEHGAPEVVEVAEEGGISQGPPAIISIRRRWFAYVKTREFWIVLLLG